MRDSAAIITTASTIAAFLVLGLALAKQNGAATPRIQIRPNESARRVDVVIDGKPFTSYIWPENLAKPTLYPLRAADGTVVTRGFPLEPRSGERVDHPHHVGLWFNYGNVNGLDFWNNSDSIVAEAAPKMGTIVHKSIRGSKSGAGEGTLDVTEEWVNHTNKVLLREDTRFVFRATNGVRSVDRITTLTALDSTVRFTDNKEGVIGMRVARFFFFSVCSQPARRPIRRPARIGLRRGTVRREITSPAASN